MCRFRPICSYDVRMTLCLYALRMKSQYYAYLLRLERSETQKRWRITLQDAHSGEIRRFVGKRELVSFLFTLLRDPVPLEPPDSDRK